MKENSIKEDIKLLREMKNNCLNGFEYYTNPKAREKAEAIEHILSDYKRILKENEYMHNELDKQQTKINKYAKENEELKADNYELNNRITDLLENIPIQEVKDKIEELEKAYENSKDENGESIYYYPDYAINILQELIEESEGK